MKFSKDEYTLRNFSKIQHKKWELYIITRIIHFLNDPDIEFVCQQLLKTRDGKRYLADLCFPSLKLYYEIDESQHGSDEHKIKDKFILKNFFYYNLFSHDNFDCTKILNIPLGFLL